MEALLAEQFPLPAELGVSAEVANTDQFDPAMHGHKRQGSNLTGTESPASINATLPQADNAAQVNATRPAISRANTGGSSSLSELEESGAGSEPTSPTASNMASSKENPSNPPLVKSGKNAKKSHARKQPKGHIPRPRNAFILFRKHITDNNLIPTSVEVKHQNISMIAAKMWSEAPANVKAEFAEAARVEKEEHAKLYPNYRYQPAYRRNDIVRRRVRKDVNEDDKCDAVANLLISGAGGKKLEEGVKEELAKKAEEPVDPKSVKLVVKRGRRRRKDAPGELSKGAIRAQKAAARAKAMREQWMDTNLLLNGMRNQANGAVGGGEHPQHYQHMHDPRFGDMAYGMPYDERYADGYYEDGYEIPYGVEVVYPEEYAQNGQHPGGYYYAEDNYSPVEGQPMFDGPMYEAAPMHVAAGYPMPPPPLPHNEYPQQAGYEYVGPVRYEMPAVDHLPQMDYPADTLEGGMLPTPRPEHSDFLPQAGPSHAQYETSRQPGSTNHAHDGQLLHDPAHMFPSHAQQYDDQYNQPDPIGSRPSDIIAGRWAAEAGYPPMDPALETLHVDHHMPAQSHPPTAQGQYPAHGATHRAHRYGDHPDILPSEGVDLGLGEQQAGLFGDVLGDGQGILPLDPDMEDYQHAVQQNREMDMLQVR